MTTQLGLRLNGWHEQRLMELAKENFSFHTTIARQLLMAAIEQTSDNPPTKTKPSWLNHQTYEIN